MITHLYNLVSRFSKRLTTTSIVTVLSLCVFSGSATAEYNFNNTFDVSSAIDTLSDVVAAGTKDTIAHLNRLGFISEARKLSHESRPINVFSADTIIKNLYERAEIYSKGEGDRFLAVLYKDAASKSAAVAVDPNFKWARKFSPYELNIKNNPIIFAPEYANSNNNRVSNFPRYVDEAIEVFSRVYEGRGLIQARIIIIRNVKNPSFSIDTFNKILAESSSTKDALNRILFLGTPPPAKEQALLGIYRDAINSSAALSKDPVMQDNIKTLEAKDAEIRAHAPRSINLNKSNTEKNSSFNIEEFAKNRERMNEMQKPKYEYKPKPLK
jgi:hypothetical protein